MGKVYNRGMTNASPPSESQMTDYPQLTFPQFLTKLSLEGWICTQGDDGGGWETNGADEALDLFNSVDESWFRFTKGDNSHVVYCVMSNGPEWLTDYGFSDPDTDGFEALMDEVIDLGERAADFWA